MKQSLTVLYVSYFSPESEWRTKSDIHKIKLYFPDILVLEPMERYKELFPDDKKDLFDVFYDYNTYCSHTNPAFVDQFLVGERSRLIISPPTRICELLHSRDNVYVIYALDAWPLVNVPGSITELYSNKGLSFCLDRIEDDIKQRRAV